MWRHTRAVQALAPLGDLGISTLWRLPPESCPAFTLLIRPKCYNVGWPLRAHLSTGRPNVLPLNCPGVTWAIQSPDRPATAGRARQHVRHATSTCAGRLAMSRATDDRADQFDYPPPADAGRRDTAHDLRDRLTGLGDAHPSSADYAARPGLERMPDSRERPEPLTLPPDKAVDRQRAGREMAPELTWPDDVIMLADRREHILDGDPGDGGGHRSGTGHPNKTEFPPHWSDDRIIDSVLTIAANPGQQPERAGWRDRWQLSGTRDGVGIVAIVESDGRICTAWPLEGSPGVVKNPVKDG
jgi:Bacterial EndoU nuclease